MANAERITFSLELGRETLEELKLEKEVEKEALRKKPGIGNLGAECTQHVQRPWGGCHQHVQRSWGGASTCKVPEVSLMCLNSRKDSRGAGTGPGF